MGEKKNAAGASARTSRTPESRIASAAKRLRIDDLAIVEGQGDDGRAVRVRGTVGGYLGIDRLMQRAAPRQTTPAALVADRTWRLADGHLADLAAVPVPADGRRSLALEQLALLDLRQGRIDAARAQLKKLVEDTTAPNGVRGRAGALLDRVGG